jgi:amidophosphoribosyltransferase
VPYSKIRELKPAHAFIIKKNGTIREVPFLDAGEKKSCSFERIYFSRGNDRDIYSERKQLGAQLAQPVLEAVDYDIENTVFTYVPNTAEAAFIGLICGIEKKLQFRKVEKILALGPNPDAKSVAAILSQSPRVEKIIHKDAKLRTFIADDNSRGALVSHGYDITYGIVRDGLDNIVLLDDSIVRGTTLKQSIISIVGRLNPKKIIVVSSAPQIRYPDCYGIDMSRIKAFVAFKALLKSLELSGKMHLLEETYERCKKSESLSKDETKNEVKPLYEHFSTQELSAQISKIVTPANLNIEVQVIFQTIEGLHKACPDNKGDWYFTGNYPTPGGNKVVNRAFINFMENKNERAY